MIIWLISMGCLPQLEDERLVEIPNNPYHDYDGDGWSENDGDCNDENNRLKIPFRYYLDGDADGFPSRSQYVDVCSWSPPIVRRGQYILEEDVEEFDCVDDDATIHPEAIEVCDGVDNDCNREIDERITDLTPRFYYDGDGDGFGRPMDADGDGVVDDMDGDGYPDASVQACYAPAGYVLDSTDCDDEDPLNFPTNLEVCDGQDNNCNNAVDEVGAIGEVDWFLDGDQDTYPDGSSFIRACERPSEFYVVQRSDGSVDCDDTNGDIYPEAVEECNQKDDDCNGLIDDSPQVGLVECYLDLDGDGFGDELNAEQVCGCSVGYVGNLDDCDDSNSMVYPNAVEYCNGLDDDCNAVVDDQAVNPTIYYYDGDGDTVGGNTTLISCPIPDGVGDWMAPVGYVEVTGDCDDNNATVSPLLPELCSSGVDENCDGDNTLGAANPNMYWVDTDGDSVGDPNYALPSCFQPIGYVLVSDESTAPVDCNDSDPTTYPGAPEVCNGKLDDCDFDDGNLTPPPDEEDGDGDNYVACIGFDINTWQGTTLDLNWIMNEGVGGDGDCDPTDGSIYPHAPEECDGVFQDCSDLEIGIEMSPAPERDDDGDGFVDCQDYDPLTWTGSSLVVGGADCDDANPTTYPGAVSTPSTNECFADDNQDGIADCSLDGTGAWTTCEEEELLDFYGHQMDFALVPAGTVIIGSPASPNAQGTIEDYGPEMGRKTFEYQVEMTISQDLYVQTSEVTQGMYESLLGDLWQTNHAEDVPFEALTGLGDDYPIYYLSWHMAADFANHVTVRHNAVKGVSLQECYDCTDSGTGSVQCEQAMDPYVCDGYRLPTVVEWEHFARAGAEHAFWTPDDIGNLPRGNNSSFISQVDARDECTDLGWFFDAGINEQNVLSQYTLNDFAWYCGNSDVGGISSTHPVRQKLPNGYGLYDVHGNVGEWTHDLVDNYSIGSNMAPQIDYLGDTSATTPTRSFKGGAFTDLPRILRIAAYGKRTANYQYQASGMRLVRLGFPVQ